MGKKTLGSVTNEKETESQAMDEKAGGHVWPHAKEGRALMNSAPSSMGFHPTQDSTVFNVKFVRVCVSLEANGKTSSFPESSHLAAALCSPWGGGVGPLHVEPNGDDCWCGEIKPTAKSHSFQFLSTFNI